MISAINCFYLNLEQDTAKSDLINILNNIYATIHSHFMLEEKVMKRNAYDEYEQHRKDHVRLLDDIRDFTMDLETSSEFDEQQLKQTLNDWFIVHFKTHDARLHKLE